LGACKVLHGVDPETSDKGDLDLLELMCLNLEIGPLGLRSRPKGREPGVQEAGREDFHMKKTVSAKALRWEWGWGSGPHPLDQNHLEAF
jgi:hypothetical protein